MGMKLELTVVAVVRLAKVCIAKDIEFYNNRPRFFVFNCYDNPMFLCYIVTERKTHGYFVDNGPNKSSF